MLAGAFPAAQAAAAGPAGLQVGDAGAGGSLLSSPVPPPRRRLSAFTHKPGENQHVKRGLFLKLPLGRRPGPHPSTTWSRGRGGKGRRKGRGLSPRTSEQPRPWLCLCFRSCPGAHCSDTKAASPWGSRRGVGDLCALICWLGHWIINYGCAGNGGPSHRHQRLGIQDEASFPRGTTLPANCLWNKTESKVWVETF